MTGGPIRPSAFATAEEIIISRARREPHRPALGWRDRMILLGRLAAHVESRAGAFAESLPRGAVVAQLMADTPGLVGTTLAAWRQGATVVPLDPILETDAIAARLEQSSVDALVAHEEFVEAAGAALRACGSRALLVVSRGLRLIDAGRPGRGATGRGDRRVVDLAGRRRARPSAAASGAVARVNEVAFHAYLPEATGRPRAALLTHANVVSSALRIGIARGDGNDDVALATGRLSEVSTLVAEVLSRLLSGGSVVLLGSGGAAAVVERIEAHRVTDVSLSAEVASGLVESPSPKRRAIRSVRKVLLREPSLALTVKRELGDRFPAAELLQTWSRVEATDGLATARQGAVFRKPDTLGTPHPGLVVGVVDPEGRMLRPGETGEIVCRGAVLMRGYLDAPAATREVLRDGWLHTGDLGYIDGDGDLALSGGRPTSRRRSGTTD